IDQCTFYATILLNPNAKTILFNNQVKQQQLHNYANFLSSKISIKFFIYRRLSRSHSNKSGA
ncbi:hypothetical protein CEN45_09795, partial [Fischerella thermalis CCMEE 5198]